MSHPTATHAHPLDWFGKLQRAYMLTGDESALEEAGDVGRLMAVTGMPVENVLDLHSRILCEEIARSPSQPPETLVVAAVTCLAEVLVAWRMAAEGVGAENEAGGSVENGRVPPVFLRFDPNGSLSLLDQATAPHGNETDLPGWAQARSLEDLVEALSGACRCSDIQRMIDQRRLSSFEMPRPAPGQILLRVVVCPFRDGSGIIGIHDVTARVAARDAEIRRRKLESLGQFAGGVAHEINNLLQPIVTIAQLLLEDHAGNAELSEDLGIVLGSAHKAADILKDILVYARQVPPPLVSLPLGLAVHQALEPLRCCLPAGIELVEDLADCGNESVVGNPSGLGQVLDNLIHNAADAMRSGGTITVSAGPCEVSWAEGIRLGLPAGQYLRLSVADQGPGIDPHHVQRIFDPFFTTKDIGKGTGLGLSIVSAIIKSWGGEVAVRSESKIGAVFDVFLSPWTPSDPLGRSARIDAPNTVRRRSR